MSEHDHLDLAAADIKYQTEIETQEVNLFAALKPTLKRDGNRWCVLLGENLQEGVAGFGDSPHHAVMDFNENWYKSVKTKELFPGTLKQLDTLRIKL